MAKKTDSLELLLDFGIDEKTRSISLFGDVNEDMLHDLNVGMSHLEKINNETITIRLSTHGGSVAYGLAIIDRITSSVCETHIHAAGEICSMGIFILASGSVRTASPLTMFMHHETSYDFDDKHSSNKNYVKFNDKLDDRMCRWLAKKTKKDFLFWKKAGVGVDHWFFAEEALDYGLIDEIMGD